MKMFNKWIIGAWNIFYFLSYPAFNRKSREQADTDTAAKCIDSSQTSIIRRGSSIDIVMCLSVSRAASNKKENISLKVGFFMLVWKDIKGHQVLRMTCAVNDS